MKATVIVRLKPAVLDPEGEAVRRAALAMGANAIQGVRVGKLIEIECADGTSRDAIVKLAQDLLANPVMEDFEVTLVDGL